jgi:MFS family permease
LTQFGYSFSTELWQFYLLSFLSGVFINGIGVMAVGILVNKWFIDKKGLATGIAYSGSGLLAAILIPLANRFIELNGWRWTYRFLGFVSLGVLIPVILLIIKDKPLDIGLEPYRSGERDRVHAQPSKETDTGITREEAFRSVSFWLLAFAVMGITLCQAGPHVHTVSFLSDIGYTTVFASTVSSVYMVLLTVCKVVMGFVFDRLGSLKASLLIGGCCVLFPIFALSASFPAVPWIYALLLAAASSGSTVLGTVLTADYFGRKDFSRVYSIISMFSYAGVAVSSPVLGSIFDITGSYSFAWFLIIGMGIVVCLCLFGANKVSKNIIIPKAA